MPFGALLFQTNTINNTTMRERIKVNIFTKDSYGFVSSYTTIVKSIDDAKGLGFDFQIIKYVP